MSRFRALAVSVPPGGERPYDEAEWGNALVIVERGEIDVEFLSGSGRRFARGETLWLCGLPVRALLNPGREPAVLLALSRSSGHERLVGVLDERQ